MNVILMVLFKAAVFLFSYIAISRSVLKFFKKRNPSAELTDIEIIAVSVVSAAFITSAAKYILKHFI